MLSRLSGFLLGVKRLRLLLLLGSVLLRWLQTSLASTSEERENSPGESAAAAVVSSSSSGEEDEAVSAEVGDADEIVEVSSE